MVDPTSHESCIVNVPSVMRTAVTRLTGWVWAFAVIGLVEVHGGEAPHFEHDVLPILSRFGCNSGGCHGKAEGQNGFKLSVFGFDPDADWSAIVQEGRGRRVFPPVPDRSLLLAKASGGVPHGGGVRIGRNTASYRVLRDWVAAGVPRGDPDAPGVVELEITPSARTLTPLGEQPLRVHATYADGRRLDVTGLATFQTNDEGLATVDESGRVSVATRPGDVAIMAAFAGRVAVFRAVIPRTGPVAATTSPPAFNYIDTHVDAKLRELRIAPSGLCDDATFLRRASLDLTGTLPTADEARRFLADERPDKRARLVDELLERPEYADRWSLVWSDLLRVDRLALGHEGAAELHGWIRSQFAANRPFDEFARELLTAEGPLRDVPAGYFFKTAKTPGDMANQVAQAFLGVRIECAQCHHHPYDRWSQTDYQGMAAHFGRVGYKKTDNGEVIGPFANGRSKHPRTGEVVHAHPLDAPNPKEEPANDGRAALADWMTAPENPWFARSFVNRVWAHMTGRGLVEPVDDFRMTNPPSNPALLNALAADFVAHDFDVKHLLRTIAASRTYQLSSEPNETNADDSRNHSRAPLKRVGAEVLYDAVCSATGVPEKFEGVPAGTRAIQLWDSQVKHDFLRLFGRPVRATTCTCERSVEPSVGQVLHVLNSPAIQAKLSHVGGRLARLEQRVEDDGALVEELYLTFLTRMPTDDERTALVAFLAENSSRRRTAVEDIAWSLLNSVEFAFTR